MRRLFTIAPLALAGIIASAHAAAKPEPEPPPPNTDEPLATPEPTPPSAADSTKPVLPMAPPGIEPLPGAPTDPTTNEADKRIGVGIDALFLFPIGGFARDTGPLAGPLLRFGYRVIPTVELAMRAGYVFGTGTEQGSGALAKFDILPVWLEARWLILDPFYGPYLDLAGGMNIFVPTITPPIAGAAGDTITKIRQRGGVSAGAGYILSPSFPIDIRVQALLPNLIGEDTKLNDKRYVAVAASAGYTFQF